MRSKKIEKIQAILRKKAKHLAFNFHLIQYSGPIFLNHWITSIKNKPPNLSSVHTTEKICNYSPERKISCVMYIRKKNHQRKTTYV